MTRPYTMTTTDAQARDLSLRTWTRTWPADPTADLTAQAARRMPDLVRAMAAEHLCAVSFPDWAVTDGRLIAAVCVGRVGRPVVEEAAA